MPPWTARAVRARQDDAALHLWFGRDDGLRQKLAALRQEGAPHYTYYRYTYYDYVWLHAPTLQTAYFLPPVTYLLSTACYLLPTAYHVLLITKAGLTPYLVGTADTGTRDYCASAGVAAAAIDPRLDVWTYQRKKQSEVTDDALGKTQWQYFRHHNSNPNPGSNPHTDPDPNPNPNHDHCPGTSATTTLTFLVWVWSRSPSYGSYLSRASTCSSRTQPLP